MRLYASSDRQLTTPMRCFFFQAEDGIRDGHVTGVQTCALPISIERGYVLWADCDGEPAVAALQAFEPAPSIVIASGSGCNCHAYWLLQAPLPIEELEHANRRLAHALGADPASADAARILRVPGTLSHKHAPPTAVEAIRTDFERRLAVTDVVGELPDLPQAGRTPTAPHPA